MNAEDRPTVLITGASSGIGAAAASALAARGFRVFGTHRRPRPDADPKVSWIAMDVCDEPSVEAGVARVVEESERIDGVVCCAGFGIYGSVEDVTIADAQRQLDTNFFGVLRVLRAVLPGMRASAAAGRDARVVLVAPSRDAPRSRSRPTTRPARPPWTPSDWPFATSCSRSG